MGITLRADNVNGSLSDPALMDALEQLHACGMAELDVEGNDVGGQLLPRWGRFANLRVLNVGACSWWLRGGGQELIADLKLGAWVGVISWDVRDAGRG
jgi:hypothetical protein